MQQSNGVYNAPGQQVSWQLHDWYAYCPRKMRQDAYGAMKEGEAVKVTDVGVGRVTLMGPLPVPMATEHTANDALSPLPQ